MDLNAMIRTCFFFGVAFRFVVGWRVVLPSSCSGGHASSHFRGGRVLVVFIVVRVCTSFGRQETSGKVLWMFVHKCWLMIKGCLFACSEMETAYGCWACLGP
ncbi:unnamed protein product, partial [Ectocarpus sp. 8 AP-2014]